MIDYRMIIGAILILTGIILEVVYSPRLQFVRKRVLLFYNVPFSDKRVYKILL
jgi:hypothetical protein